MYDNLVNFLQLTAFNLVTWQMCVMWIVVLVLFYLAVFKEFEPLLLVPIAFGALIANLPTQGVVNQAPGPVLAPFDARVVAWHVQVGDEVRKE